MSAPVAQEPVVLWWLTAGAPELVMLTPDGYRIWVAAGPPGLVVGASAGDLYLDSDAGMLYRLD